MAESESMSLFETAMTELKEIVPEASEEVLRIFLIAADCDVNRALNNFFSVS